MSKAGSCAEVACARVSGPRTSCPSALTEDLRLDCLRLALQRQGARDSRGLLEIAEEYFRWVTAENGAAVEEEKCLDWQAVREGAKGPAPVSRKGSRRRPRASPGV